jgi:hypothetical protein
LDHDRPDGSETFARTLMMTQAAMRYSDDITAGSLKVPESRTVARLLYRELDVEGRLGAFIDRDELQPASRRFPRMGDHWSGS